MSEAPSTDVLFVSAQPWDANFGLYAEGVAMLAAVLKQCGVDVRLHITSPRETDAAFTSVLQTLGPRIVAFSFLSFEWPLIRRRIRTARQGTDSYLVAGGYHASLAPEQVLSESPIDAVCRGEAEEAFPELVRAVLGGAPDTTLRSFWFRDRTSGRIRRNPLRPVTADLDGLPEPDRALYGRAMEACERFPSLPGGPHSERSPVVPLRATRGCPFACTYCANDGMRALYGGAGGFVRRRSPSSMLKSVRLLLSQYEHPELLFLDELFPLSERWLTEFSSGMAALGSPPFMALSHCDQVTDERMRLLREAGCRTVAMGVECEDEQYRREMLGRRTSNENIRRAFGRVRSAGLGAGAFFMFGLPYETDAQLDRSVAFLEELAPEWTGAALYTPLPGSHLWERCRADGLLLDPSEGGKRPTERIRHVHLSLPKLERICRELRLDLGEDLAAGPGVVAK